MFFVLWQVVTALLVIFVTVIYLKRARVLPNSFPTIKGRIPFIGDTFVLIRNRNRVLEWVEDIINTTGSYQTSSIFVSYILLRLKPEASTVQHILKDNWKNYKLPTGRKGMLSDLVGGGIFGVDGAEWYAQRKAASHLLTANRMKGIMTRVFAENTDKFMSMLDKKCKNKITFDVQDLFFRYTMDSFCKIAFGEDVNSLQADQPPALAIAFDSAQYLIFTRLFRPFWRVNRYFNWGVEKQLKKEIKIIKECIYHSIDNRQILEQQKDANDMIDDGEADLISAFYAQAKKNGDPAPSKEYLADIMINFLVAGRDTSAVCLSWFIYEMHRNPDVEHKIYQEVCEVLSIDPLNQTKSNDYCEVKFEHAPLLKYTEGALLETLRLHPSVPLESREAVEDDVLPNGTKVPTGSVVDYSPYLFGRSSDIWPEPLKFDPGRWLPPNNPDAFMFPTFNAGPRVCLGKNLALYEMKLLVASILQKYRFNVVDIDSKTYSITLTLNVKDKLMVNATART